MRKNTHKLIYLQCVLERIQLGWNETFGSHLGL